MSDLSEFIAEGEAEFRAVPCEDYPSGLPSSSHYDAKLITWHCLYNGPLGPSVRNGRRAPMRQATSKGVRRE